MDHSLYGPKKNAAFSLYFPLLAFSGTNADPDTLQTGTTIHAADFTVSKDGGAFANTTNLPTEAPAAGKNWNVVLTAAEMNADVVVIRMVSTDGGGKQFRDAFYVIYTRAVTINDLPVSADYSTARAAKLDYLDGLNIRRNTAAAGGAATITLDAGASTTDHFYEKHLILLVSGTGAGQAQYIVNYVGGTQVATVSSPWYVNPDNTTVFQIVPKALFGSYLDVAVSTRADGANYTALRAGNLDHLDADVSSRASATFYTAGRAANLDNLDVAVSTRPDGAHYTNARGDKLDDLDATVSSRADGANYTAGRATKLDFLDVAVSTRPDGAHYTNARGDLLANLSSLDAAVSSRAATGAAMALVANAIDAAQVTAAAARKQADHVWRRTYANVRASADGDVVTWRSPLGLMAAMVNRRKVQGGQILFFHEDDVTQFEAANLTGNSGATPIVEVDPV